MIKTYLITRILLALLIVTIIVGLLQATILPTMTDAFESIKNALTP